MTLDLVLSMWERLSSRDQAVTTLTQLFFVAGKPFPIEIDVKLMTLDVRELDFTDGGPFICDDLTDCELKQIQSAKSSLPSIMTVLARHLSKKGSNPLLFRRKHRCK